MRAAVRRAGVARWTRGRTSSSPPSKKRRGRSTPRWRSSEGCARLRGPTGSTCGYGSGFIAGARPSPDSGYVGLSVHTAARICFAAHGGQIVVSSAVRSAVLESLADGVSLRNLGAWRLQGLREPETLYQVEAGDLLADFPPLRSVVPAE